MSADTGTPSAAAPDVRIRNANATDLPAIVRIHKSAYSRSHFTALLPDWVLREYYRLFLTDGSVIRVAIDETGAMEEILGFAVFGCGISEKIGVFRKQARSAILTTSARHPILSTRKAARAAFARIVARPALPPADFLLLSIAVDSKGKGIGRLLMRDLAKEAKAQGQTRIGLYVNYDNIGAINAYCALGYRIADLVDRQYYMEVEF